MMASSSKDKFDAAVKVIRGLPANGPFQPSYDLMLKFYSYYKQATEGKCTSPKPSFWDVVNKKKWEAWNKLGDMGREKAMTLYVDELKKVSNHVKETYYPPQIVETMPQTEEVGVFLQKLDTFYEMVEEVAEETTEEDNNNGDVKATTNGDVKSITDGLQEQEALNHSDNVTMLLKQDMKKVQESSGILVSPGDRRSNGHGSHNGNHVRSRPSMNGRRGRDDDADDDDNDKDGGESNEVAESTSEGAEWSSTDEESDDNEEEEDDGIENEEFVKVEASPGVCFSPNDESLRNGVKEEGDSETENEEFCDTSDEPVNSDLPDTSSHHIPQSSSSQSAHPSNSPNSPIRSRSNIPMNTSTPITHTQQQQPLHSSKSVRVNGVIPSSSSSSSSSSPASMGNANPHLHNHHHHHHRFNNRIMSDSLEVQTSRIAEPEQETEAVIKPTFASQSSGSLMSASRDSGSVFSSGGQDNSREGSGGLVGAEVNCRGGNGDEETRDRRRKGGSQSSRGGGVGSSRDGMRRGGSSGAGSGGSEGGARPPHPNRGGGGGSRDPPSGVEESHNDLNEQIVVTLLRLQRDMSGVLNRLHSLEALVKEGRKEQEERRRMAKKSAWWWPFPDLSVKSAALIFLWPIVLQVVLTYISRRRSRRLRK